MPKQKKLIKRINFNSFKLSMRKSPVFLISDLYQDKLETFDSIVCFDPSIDSLILIEELDYLLKEALEEIQYLLFDTAIKNNQLYCFENNELKIKEIYKQENSDLMVRFTYKNTYSFDIDWRRFIIDREASLPRSFWSLTTDIKEALFKGIVKYSTFIDAKVLSLLKEGIKNEYQN